jgi:hypothetical protein
MFVWMSTGFNKRILSIVVPRKDYARRMPMISLNILGGSLRVEDEDLYGTRDSRFERSP